MRFLYRDLLGYTNQMKEGQTDYFAKYLDKLQSDYSAELGGYTPGVQKLLTDPLKEQVASIQPSYNQDLKSKLMSLSERGTMGGVGPGSLETLAAQNAAKTALNPLELKAPALLNSLQTMQTGMMDRAAQLDKILAGRKDRLDQFFRSQPGLYSTPLDQYGLPTLISAGSIQLTSDTTQRAKMQSYNTMLAKFRNQELELSKEYDSIKDQLYGGVTK